jgi:hypothetical protein
LSRRFDTLQSTMAGGERILELLNTPVEARRRDAQEMGAIAGDVRSSAPSIIRSTWCSTILI